MINLQLLQKRREQRAQEEQRRAQGRLTEAEAAESLAVKSLLFPLATVHDRKDHPVTIGVTGTATGPHLLAVAPPGSSRPAQVTQLLWCWPGAALVMDTNGSLYQQTAEWRQRQRGQVYTFPGHRLHLSYYYRIWHEQDAGRLHGYLMPPFSEAERPLVDRSLPLFMAAGHFGYANRQDLLHVLLHAAAGNLLDVLNGLETVAAARPFVRQFTKGLLPGQALYDPETTAAFSLFARQLRRYQPLYDALGVHYVEEAIPRDWVAKRQTVYLTFDGQAWPEMAGLTAAIVNGMTRYHLAHGNHQRLLLVVEERVAARLGPLPELLRHYAHYNISVLLLATSAGALQSINSDGELETLLAYFNHQLWYPPNDERTASVMAGLYTASLLPGPEKERQFTGEPVSVGRHAGARNCEPTFGAAEMLGLPDDRVLVLTRRQRGYRFIAQALQVPGAASLFRWPPVPLTAAPEPRPQPPWPAAPRQHYLPAPRPDKRENDSNRPAIVQARPSSSNQTTPKRAKRKNLK